MKEIKSQIDAAIRTCVEQVSALIERDLRDRVNLAFGGTNGMAGEKKYPPALIKKPMATKTDLRALGEKRPKAEIAAVAERFLAEVTKAPGLRIEQLKKPLGVPTSDLSLPIKKLIDAGDITTKGTRRATTYWPVPVKKAAKKGGKK